MHPVTLVGAGPGDPELLTVKAVQGPAPRHAWCWSTTWSSDGVLRYVRRSARIDPRRQARRLRQHAAGLHPPPDDRRGASAANACVRLKGGDPFVFGRGGEECDALRDAGIEVEVISGLTAGIAGAGGHRHARHRPPPRARRGPGHRPRRRRPATGPTGHALVRSGLTLVIYMGVASLPAIVDALSVAGMAPQTPVAVVCCAHTKAQRQAVCTLATVADTLTREGLVSPAIVVVGDVVTASPLWSQHEGRDPAVLPRRRVANSETMQRQVANPSLRVGFIEGDSGRRL